MQIQQMMMQQNAMFAGQMQYAQQLGAPMQAAMGMPAPAPWQVPAYAMQHAAAPYGERLATGMASFASNVAAPTMMGAGALMGGLGMLGPAGRLFDPFGSALSGGMAGFARGGIMGAMGGAALGALPGYLAMKAADVYGGAFMGGVQDQSNVNNTLRSNFRFYGGAGPMGRGFSQGQMGQIGGMLSGTARGDLTTSMAELTQLTQMGAQSGQFTGVRDVQQFGQRFKQMISTLRSIQEELGGTLTEAMTFMRNANSSGVYRNLDNFASQMRSAQASTGMTQEQLFGMTQQGAALSQAMGGRRGQGAIGALRTATSLGSALSAGVINSEALQEATGLTGSEGIQALTGRLMEHTAQFSRRAMGRYSLFAMSNARGTGLDAEMVDRFASGEVGVGDISRSARRNIGRMGRMRAINNEGILRGAMLEQGGLAGQIGIMRAAMGDRVLDQGDDYASLFMQRRMRMSRPEAELMTSLMRNQGTIAMQEAESRIGSRRETQMTQELQRNRSLDAFMGRMGHSIEEGLNVPEVREAGRRFVTRMSQISERVMNHLMGVAESSMTAGDRSAINRIGLGRGTAADFSRTSRILSSTTGGDDYDPRRTGILERAFHGRESVADAFARRNVRVTNYQDTQQAFAQMEAARRGFVTGRDADVLSRMERMGEGQVGNAMALAQLAAAGNNTDAYRYMRQSGFTANAADAYRARHGMAALEGAPQQSSMLSRATGTLLEAFSATPQERATNFLASGGHMARRLRERVGPLRGDMDENRRFVESRGGRWDATRERDAGVLNAISNLDQEQVQAVLGGEDWKRTMDFISEGGRSREEMLQEIERFGNAAQRSGAPNAQTQMALAQMARSDIETNGRLGREWNVGGGGADAEARQQVLRQYSARGNVLSRLGGGSRELSDLYLRMGRGDVTGDDARNLNRQIQEAERARQESFLSMSNEDFNTQMGSFSEAIRTAGSDDEAEQIRMERMGLMQARGVDQRLRGRGRRGERGAREEAMNLLAGGATSFTIGEGTDQERNIDRRRAMELLRRGGQGSEEVMRQMYEASGVGASREAGGMGMTYDDYASQVSLAMNGGTTQEGPAGDRVRAQVRAIGESSAKERAEALQTQQRERDPMGAQTVDALNTLNTTLTNNERAEAQRHSALVGAVREAGRFNPFGGDEGGGVPPTGG